MTAGLDGSPPRRLTVDILAAVAADEARRIGERTRQALAAKKARGAWLGHPSTLTADGRAAGRDVVAASRRERFLLWHVRHGATFGQIHDRLDPTAPLRVIAAALEEADVPTPTNRYQWHATTVRRVDTRLNAPRDGARARA